MHAADETFDLTFIDLEFCPDKKLCIDNELCWSVHVTKSSDAGAGLKVESTNRERYLASSRGDWISGLFLLVTLSTFQCRLATFVWIVFN